MKILRKDITQAELKCKVSYDPDTGRFTRLVLSGGVKPGCYADRLNIRGYMCLGYGGRLYLAHRLAWLYMTGEWPKEEIDHINNIKHDNRLINLRQANRFQNNKNAKTRKDSTTGFKGVHFRKDLKKWYARISVDNKRINLGIFSTPELASEAYQIAAEKYHGDFYIGKICQV